jgi:hypothetical protein
MFLVRDPADIEMAGMIRPDGAFALRVGNDITRKEAGNLIAADTTQTEWRFPSHVNVVATITKVYFENSAVVIEVSGVTCEP